MDMLQSVMEASSQAMFTLDREGTITHINHQTKDYFGLFNHSRHSHGPGRLEPGDLVIIADTAIGSDDGNLSPADLERLNIHDRKLRAGDRIAAVSLFDSPEAKPVYKFLPGGDSATLELSTVWQDIPIRVSIDGRAASVTVGETVYTIDYFWCIGQLVVLDGNTGQVKFWEEKGYSARKEGIGNLLCSLDRHRYDTDLDIEALHKRIELAGIVDRYTAYRPAGDGRIAVDTGHNIESVVLQTGVGHKSSTQATGTGHYGIVAAVEPEEVAESILERGHLVAYACLAAYAQKRQVLGYLRRVDRQRLGQPCGRDIRLMPVLECAQIRQIPRQTPQCGLRQQIAAPSGCAFLNHFAKIRILFGKS